MFPMWSKEPQFLKKTSVDLDGDGVDEWLVPTPEGYAVRNVAGDLCPVPCEVDSSVRDGAGMVVTYRFPACHSFEIEGEATKALAFLTDEKASFAHGADWGDRKEFAIPLKLGEKWESSAMMHDINANGIPDLVVTQTEGTINLRVLTQVFLASEHFTYPETPTATFDAKGSYAAPTLKDVNGDGNLDMVFIKLPWGVRFFINLFVFRRLSVDLDVYLYNPDTGFADAPDFRSDVSIEAPEGREQPSHAMGDFNGDGRMDIAFGSGADNLVVHTGSEKRFISSKPWLTLSVPAFGVARTHDLNGNEPDDVVIFHPGMKGRDRIEVVIF
jgi:hypothetical protein